MSTHWYFGSQGDGSGVSVQSLGNRTIITLPNQMTIVASGGTVSFTNNGSSSRGALVGPRGPVHVNHNNHNNHTNNSNNQGANRQRGGGGQQCGHGGQQQQGNRGQQSGSGGRKRKNRKDRRWGRGRGRGGFNQGRRQAVQPNANTAPNGNTNDTINVIAPVSEKHQMAGAGLHGTSSLQEQEGDAGSHLGGNADEWQAVIVSGHDEADGMPAYSGYDEFDTSEETMDLVGDDFAVDFTGDGSSGTL